MIDACDLCLRRASLIAHLAPRIAGLLGGGECRATGLLALPDDDLIAAAAGRRVEQALAFLEALDVDAERERLATGAGSAVCARRSCATSPTRRPFCSPSGVTRPSTSSAKSRP